MDQNYRDDSRAHCFPGSPKKSRFEGTSVSHSDYIAQQQSRLPSSTVIHSKKEPKTKTTVNSAAPFFGVHSYQEEFPGWSSVPPSKVQCRAVENHVPFRGQSQYKQEFHQPFEDRHSQHRRINRGRQSTFSISDGGPMMAVSSYEDSYLATLYGQQSSSTMDPGRTTTTDTQALYPELPTSQSPLKSAASEWTKSPTIITGGLDSREKCFPGSPKKRSSLYQSAVSVNHSDFQPFTINEDANSHIASKKRPKREVTTNNAAPFFGETAYGAEFPGWKLNKPPNRTQIKHMNNTVPFHGQSVYKSEYAQRTEQEGTGVKPVRKLAKGAQSTFSISDGGPSLRVTSYEDAFLPTQKQQ